MRPTVCAVGRDRRWLEAVQDAACEDFKVRTAARDADLKGALRHVPAPRKVALLLVQADAADDIVALARDVQAAGWGSVIIVSNWPEESVIRALLALGLARDVWSVHYSAARLRRAILEQLAMGRSDHGGLAGARLTSWSGVTPNGRSGEYHPGLPMHW